MATAPAPASTSAADTSVLVISHSPFVFLWPIWVVGFVMAGLSYWRGHDIAFVPPGTEAYRRATVERFDGPRDVLVAPSGASLPEDPEQFGAKQPRYRMVISNNLGIIWTLTLCLCILIIHVHARKLGSLLILVAIIAGIAVLTIFGWWDALVRAIRFLEIHITATGYLSISLLLLGIWAFIYFVYDRQMAMTFTPGKLHVRTMIGMGEKVFEMKGVVLEKSRSAVFRHWLLGFGSGDLVVHTAGEHPTQIEWPNVFGIDGKIAAIRPLIEQRDVLKAQ